MRTVSEGSCLLLLIVATPFTQSQSSPAQNPRRCKSYANRLFPDSAGQRALHRGAGLDWLVNPAANRA